MQLKIDAFPFQKYGLHSAVIQSISESVVSGDEREIGTSNDGSLTYRLVAALEKQTVLSRGEEIPFKAGMSVEAEISLARRSLFEWFFEPLYRKVSSTR